MEVDVELLHPVVDHVHLVIAHHPDQETQSDSEPSSKAETSKVKTNSYKKRSGGGDSLTAS